MAVINVVRFIVAVPGLYCRIQANDYQRSADFFLKYWSFDKQSFGYKRGEMAQALANIFDAMATSLGAVKE